MAIRRGTELKLNFTDFLLLKVQLLHYTLRWLDAALKRLGAVSVRLYADDHHPPHFHIVGVDFQVLVRISDLSVIAGEARPALLAEALAWAADHQQELALKSAELSERD